MIKISSFAVTILISLVIICFSITGTVFGQAKNLNKIQDGYREEMEEYYIEEVRLLLESKCIYDSGITMTKVIYEDGLFTYQMMIHNQSIDRMPYYEKQQLLKELQKVNFPDSNSLISHHFLEIEKTV